MKIWTVTYSDGKQVRTCSMTLARYEAMYGKMEATLTPTEDECDCDRCKAAKEKNP